MRNCFGLKLETMDNIKRGWSSLTNAFSGSDQQDEVFQVGWFDSVFGDDQSCCAAFRLPLSMVRPPR